MRHLPHLFTVLLIAACGGPTHDDSAQPPADVIVRLDPWFRDLRTVRAVTEVDTLTLLVDTGGGATLITPAAARRRGCRPYGRDVGHRMSGEPVEFARCDSLRFSLAGWDRRLEPVAVFDVNALLPPELPRLDGVLALDAFVGQVVTLDWPGGRLVVHAPHTSAAALDAGGIPYRAATGPTGRMLTVFAEVAGRRGPLWFLLDSGNLRGTLLDAHIERDSLLASAGESVELHIGQRDPIRVSALTDTLIVDGVLGTDYLQRGSVVLDLRTAPRPW